MHRVLTIKYDRKAIQVFHKLEHHKAGSVNDKIRWRIHFMHINVAILKSNDVHREVNKERFRRS